MDLLIIGDCTGKGVGVLTVGEGGGEGGWWRRREEKHKKSVQDGSKGWRVGVWAIAHQN